MVLFSQQKYPDRLDKSGPSGYTKDRNGHRDKRSAQISYLFSVKTTATGPGGGCSIIYRKAK